MDEVRASRNGMEIRWGDILCIVRCDGNPHCCIVVLQQQQQQRQAASFHTPYTAFL
jgi:hypothetical protein